VVIGAGFGGIHVARGLRGANCNTVVVDRNNYHLFQPLLYQVATGLLDPSEIAHPVRAILRRTANATFRLGDVTTVDTQRRCVGTADGREIAYDHLVIATGSSDNHFGIKGAAANSHGLKTLDGALALRADVLRAFEHAAISEDAAERSRLRSFVIIGGGPSGVEMAGALAELVDHVLSRDFPEMHAEDVRIDVVEAAPRLLPAFHRKLSAAAMRTLRGKRVRVHVGRRVIDVSGSAVTLDDGTTLDTETVIWTAGVHGTIPGGVGAGGASTRVPVDGHLRARGTAGVFIIGDAALSTPIRGKPLPMLAPVAIQQGDHVAAVIRAELAGSRLPAPFRYHDKGTMATIGRNSAVAELGRLRFSGFIGWVMWLVVHLLYIVSFRSKAVVLINWGWNYLFLDRPVRLITAAQRPERLEPPSIAQEQRHAEPSSR